MICKDCEQLWEGGTWERKTRPGRFDYLCNKCGSKKAPVEHEQDLDNRVLVIPDTHFPFSKAGYLDFVAGIYKKYRCNKVVHLGDILDNHYSSYHDTDPDGFGGAEELDRALDEVAELAMVFPDMKVCYGNHDRLPNRKAFSSGLSKRWIKTIKEVILDAGIDIDGWEFADHHVIGGVKYIHGEGRQAKQRMTQDGVSVVQGHFHAKSYVEWLVNDSHKLFAMQLGALIDDEAYSFAYGKHFAKSHKNCGVVINGVPIIEYLPL